MALTDCPRCWNTPCDCGYYKQQTFSHSFVYDKLIQRITELENRVKKLEKERKTNERQFINIHITEHSCNY